MNQPKRFQRALISSLVASYVLAVGNSAADPGIKKVDGTNFFEPTFTKADIDAVQKQRNTYLNGDIFVGRPGQTNRHVQPLTPERIFQPNANTTGMQTYIVQLSDEPVATYRGGVPGYSATAATKTRSLMTKGRVSMKSKAVTSYQAFLKNKQMHFIETLQNAGGQAKLKHQYTVALNAILVEMTQQDAVLMSKQSGVKRITPNRMFKLHTDRGPEFIGADKLWTGVVSDNGIGVKGEGMVVGIIDTGINTDHIAFADDEGYANTNPRGKDVFVGDCVTEPNLCNNKLIGVRSYPEITNVYSASAFQEYPWQSEQIRPANGEDYNGHGSHVASTAAGNEVIDTPLQTADGTTTSDGVNLPFNFPKTSGVAPRAHIISYQVCFPGGGGDPYAGCPESVTLAAIEDAIADGVDTINFSIGGAESFPWEDPTELAFLAAREAGISVAVAAGNAGAFWSADHASPWLTTVGASTHDRIIEVGVTSIDNFEGENAGWSKPYEPIIGKGYTSELSGEFVLAENFPDPNVNDEYSSASCNVPFPAGTFTKEQIVVCERGDIARVDKAVNVAAGGAGGIVLQNIDYNSQLVADKFVIPGINVAANSRWTLRNWISNSSPGTAKATIKESTNTYEMDPTKGNQLAYFSSMGPSRTNNTLVPDLTAPGVEIYAANADDQPFTQYPDASDWTFMSGTSMASPHVTGALTLLSQLHPNWTPAEIQSALMMTAGDVSVNTGWQIMPTQHHFMAGAGAINLERAAKTGLVLDETIDNYREANPKNGGFDNWLNIPSMVEMECESTCTWMRTVKATKDGAWKIEGFGKEDGVKISVSPSEFSLKAGETQAIMVRASLPDLTEYKVEPTEPGAPWEGLDNNYTFFNGELKLTEVNGNSPTLRMPIVAANVVNQLPVSLKIDAQRNQGSETIMVNTDHYSQFTPRYFGLVKPELIENELTVTGPYLVDYMLESSWDIRPLTVPEGTKRLVVKVKDFHYVDKDNGGYHPRYGAPHPIIAIGKDKNGNGTFIPSKDEMAEDYAALNREYQREVSCLSSSKSELNYCNIINPEPGEYWIATAAVNGEYDAKLSVTTAYAMVKDNVNSGNITLSGPESHDGNGDYPIVLSWDLGQAKEGDMYFGAFDLGNTPGAEGTLGLTALDITRSKEAISWSVSQDQAKAMDVLDVKVKLRANMESDPRDYVFDITMPQGMRLATGTIWANNAQSQAAIVADNSSFKLSGTQLSTRNVAREYITTTNITNAHCRTPMIDEQSDGGYIDLFEFGIQPNAEWMVGDANNYVDVPMDWLFWLDGAEFKVFNQDNEGYMRMFPVGANSFNPIFWPMQWHRGPGFLYESLAPFWRGSFSMDYAHHWEDPRGLTIATQYASDRPDLGDLLFLEYDNVKDKYTGDEYDFQMILRSGISYQPNQFEIIYAYDNLGSNLADGVVMVEGFDSAFSANVGAKEGYLSSVLGFDNLDEVLQDDLVVCFDYVGPEQSEIEFAFKVAVSPEATGSVQDIKFDYSLTGQNNVKAVHSVTVNSNIKVAEIADMSVQENGRIENIEVFYVDANKVANNIEVSGENITAEVTGNSFNLIPAPDFHGETEVTVTVRDIEHAGDASSTSFMLTVISDGIEKGCTDSKATNYNANANQDDGSCVYPTTVVEQQSGGALGAMLILLLGLPSAIRRRVAK